MCNMWRVRNAKSKRLTFLQNHSSAIIQRSFDYRFPSNTLQEFVAMAEILTPISKDHTPVLFSLSKGKGSIRSIWKFNSSSTKRKVYKHEIKN